MRSIPVDSSRVTMISTGKVTPVPVWVELSSGERRPDPNGRQEHTDTGVPLWRVEVIIPGNDDDDRDRTGITEITVAQQDRPDAGAFGDVLALRGLVMAPGYLSRKTGRMSEPRWSADGLGVQRNGRPAAAPAASA